MILSDEKAVKIDTIKTLPNILTKARGNAGNRNEGYNFFTSGLPLHILPAVNCLLALK